MLHQDLDVSWVFLYMELEHLHSCSYQNSSHVVHFAHVHVDHYCIFHVFLLSMNNHEGEKIQ